MTGLINIPRQPRRAHINLTPIMDVVFILVVFFLLAAQFTQEASQTLSLASNGSAAQVETEAPARLVVREAVYLLDGEALSADQLSAALGALGTRPLVVEAADDAPYQALVTALDAAAKAGIAQIRIAPRDQPESDQ